MVTAFKCFAGIAASWAVVGLAPPAWGQVSFGQRPIYGQMPFPLNPNPQIAPGVSLQQYAFNVQVLGRAYGNIPPYLLGYNPYLQYGYYGPPYGSTVVQPVYLPSAPSYGAGTPYTGGYGSFGGYSPYYGGGYTGGYNAYPQFANYGPAYGSRTSPPAGYSPANAGYGGGTSYAGGYGSRGGSTPYYGGNAYTGGYSAGSVDPLTGQSTAGNSGNSGASDNAPKGSYGRANPSTINQPKLDVPGKILDRAQRVPTSQEVASGKSLNILIEDLHKLASLPLRDSAVMLDEEVLKLLNLTGKEGGNLGLLRDNGRFAWPSVFDEKNVAGDQDKRDVELHAQELFQQALNAKIDKNALKNIRSSLSRLRESLSKSFKDVAGLGYLDGLRFLDSFDAAVLALEKGDALLSLDFQQKFARGGKTVQELVDYMKSKGLRFAPANPGDERIYQILQTALAAYSMALHNQISAAAKE
jgi:hypothetical protein